MGPPLPPQNPYISTTIPTDCNIQSPTPLHNHNQWKQDLIISMSKSPAQKAAEAAQRLSLWQERLVGKLFVEHWWQWSGSEVCEFYDAM